MAFFTKNRFGPGIMIYTIIVWQKLSSFDVWNTKFKKTCRLRCSIFKRHAFLFMSVQTCTSRAGAVHRYPWDLEIIGQ
jgi:hypothetical protein